MSWLEKQLGQLDGKIWNAPTFGNQVVVTWHDSCSKLGNVKALFDSRNVLLVLVSYGTKVCAWSSHLSSHSLYRKSRETKSRKNKTFLVKLVRYFQFN
jgi:hypothetical protein